jgi:hypothetical protein
VKTFEIVALVLAGVGGAIIIGTAVYNMTRHPADAKKTLPAGK